MNTNGWQIPVIIVDAPLKVIADVPCVRTAVGGCCTLLGGLGPVVRSR